MHEELEFYIRGLSRLKRGSTKFGMAPHKPILLLTLIQLIEEGEGVKNEFYVDALLVAKFQEVWINYVDTLHQADFTQPFYYLQNDQYKKKHFWYLKPKAGYSINSHIKSIFTLSDVLEYGYLDPNLYQLLQDPTKREFLKSTLVNQYFPQKSQNSQTGVKSYINHIESEILNEPIEPYKRIITTKEDEVYVRNGIFKRVIPRIYESQCSFTGMKLVSMHGYSLIDACHIVPFSVSQNDKISNGIALCPNMHRAFDRGIVSLDQDFNILVSDHFEENTENNYSLRKLKGRKAILPAKIKYQPSRENLEWHRKNIFKS